MEKTILLGFIIGAFVTATATSNVFEAAYATITKDPGASGEAPGENPQIPGWDPGLASDDAPGQLKEGPHCIGCAAEDSPGHNALESGAIGPKK